MQQLTQTLKNGTMKIIEVPFPALNDNSILVRNHYSLISAGTEGKTVKDARLGYIGKAKARQKEVKMVIDSVKTQGLSKTYQMVMNKLDAPSALGYSSAGEVIDVGRNITEFKVGDLVACGGGGAVHAEIVSIPLNLAVKVDKNIDLKYAAFTTVASIALQGIRQADLRLGENCAVIGLGLIGQLTIQLLNAAGINSIGIDIDEKQVEMSNRLNASLSLSRNNDGLEEIIKDYTDGFGVDAVIITAGTSSSDPVELSGRLCRQKGKVIIVGAVPTGFSREHYYKKELELKMSCSYGPGRYDTDYEEKGIDYPIGYVRWTENRNMKAFVDLLSQKKINIEPLITHIFDFNKAPDAYKLIVERSEPFTGILLKYDIHGHSDPDLSGEESLGNGHSERSEESRGSKSYSSIQNSNFKIQNPPISEIQNPNSISSIQHPISSPQLPAIGFIGAGSFAQNMILPNIPKEYKFIGVATSRGNTSKNVADKYGFSYATTASDDIINDEKINTVFITTRHNQHAEYVLKGFKSGKNVFVEKPLCMTETELQEINSTYFSPSSIQGEGSNIQHPSLMVGFNRRFSPHIQEIKKRTLDNMPKAINYRINAGYLAKEHWTQDLEIGGGRIIGEVCHFIDLSMFIAGSKIHTVYAAALKNNENLNDTLNIQLTFANGSIANISYFANGSKQMLKEYLEVFYSGNVYIVKDFKEMEIFSAKKNKTKLGSQDKGHKNEVEIFLKAIKEGKPSPIPFDEIYLSTLATFKVIESIKTGIVINL